MSAKKEGIVNQLRTVAEKWIEEKLPERLSAVGVSEAEVRKQLEVEAENWIKYNLDQYSKGKEGTPSPDALLEKEGSLDPTLR
jgi:hypothetical protein